MSHAITYIEREAVEFGKRVTLTAARCSCGWKGVWYADEQRAEMAAHSHRIQVPAMLEASA